MAKRRRPSPGLTFIAKRPNMATRGALLVRVDPLALELIERCARTLAEWGLEDFIDELTDREAWRTGAWETQTIRGVLMVKLGPMTELFLWECLDVARRPGWTESGKRLWLLQVMDAIGFRRSVPSAEPTSD